MSKRLRQVAWSMCGALVVLSTTSCKEELTGPTPTIASPTAGAALPVDPGIICAVQHSEEGTALTVSGENLAPIPFDIPNDPKVGLPDLTWRRTSGVDGSGSGGGAVEYGGEPGESNSSLLAWASPSQMSVFVTDGVGFEPGIYDLTVTNANGESATSTGALAVVDRPTPTGVVPGLVCLAESDRNLTISGSSFVRIADGRPTVTFGSAEPLEVDLADCADVAHAGIDAETCDTLEVTIPQDYVEPGTHPIVVRNPETAACESDHETDSVELVVVGPPTIDSVEPASVCSLSMEPVAVTFSGTNFINAGGESFTVTINGAEVTPDSVDGCEVIEVDDLDAESCTSFTVTLNPGDIPEGGVEVGIHNPESVGCGFTTDMLFTVLGPPVITSVEPPLLCSDQQQTITINGQNFAPGATVSIGGTQADTVDVQSSTVIIATFDEGVAAGSYDITVSNGAGCDGTLTAGALVEQSPIVFFVDPPVIYNGVSFEITIFTSGLDENAIAVSLIDANGDVTDLPGFQSPTRPNRILATVPSGLAPGEYEVSVTDTSGCLSAFNGSLTITDNLTLNLDGIDPSFVSPTLDTAVTISATAPPALVSTPRAYINPNPAMAGATAVALEATVLVDTETLTAVIPGGLIPGSYDLIVVNPTGEVGLLAQGLTVAADEPPFIDTVTPATLANNTDYDVVIVGGNFDAAGVTVSLDCEAPDGSRMQYAATTGATSATSVTATLPTSGITKGSVCLLTVTNDADGTSFTYSAISITNSSYNLEPWTAASPMGTPRRALALEAGRPTRTSRFLYAMGGDNGTLPGAYASVESASVDVFGDIGSWADQRNSLPSARTFGTARQIGRFLYYAGGSDGALATSDVWRAQILDPLATPEILDVDAALGDGTNGLGGGLWMYRVSAVFPAGDINNPGGESLPGEVQNVDLPQIDELIQLTIQWEQIPGAAGYRIYRSPSADAAFSELTLVAEIPDAATTTWTDDGAAPPANTTPPLASGSTGVWHAMPSLNTARQAHAMMAAPIPGAANAWALYVFGGRSLATTLSSVEYTTVTIAADGSQTMDPWTTAAATLASPISDMKAFRVKGSDAAAVPAGANWIYVGPGTNGGAAVNQLQAFEVTAALEPGFFNVNRTVSGGGRAGYCSGASNGFLYIFGGAAGNPNDGGISAELCTSTAGNCGNNVPPDLRQGAWNSLGISMSDPRVYCDVAQESAFYFAGGGWDGSAPLSSVDTTVQ